MRGSSASLRRGLITRVVAALAAIGVLGVIAAYPLGGNYAELVYDRELFDDVATLAEQVEARNGVLRLNLPPAGQKWLLADRGEDVRYRVIDLRDGAVVAGNGNLGSWPRAPIGAGEPYYRDVVVGNSRYRVAYTHHLVDPDDIPVLVEVGETLRKRELMRRQIVGGMVLLICTMVMAAVALVWKGVASELAPLRAIEEAAASRSSTNLTPLDAGRAPREVRGLLEAINRMMDRLGEAIESQRSFTANAAHQLRTPLAGARLQAQMALKQTTSGTVRASLQEIEASATRAARVLEQLLTLSRAETRALLKDAERVDLADVARRVIERHLPAAIGKDIDLGYEGLQSGADVHGSEVLLSELLGNLIDNSVRYGRPGGRVTVSTTRAPDSIVLTVADDGPGFPAEERTRVFERFFRTDSSAGGGAGLGLAIVKEIAGRYAAKLSLETIEGEGSRFIVAFPREASP
jgi:two-component system, OmpR family, sensor histidine kinase TctE